MSNLLSYLQTSLKDPLLSVSLFCHLASIILCALILSEVLALYKSFTYSLTYLQHIMDTLRNRQKRWLGHVLHHDSPLITVLEGWLSRKKEKEKPKEMLLSCLLETSERNISYPQLKDRGYRIEQDEVDENKNPPTRAEYNARSIQHVQHVCTGNDVRQCRHNARVHVSLRSRIIASFDTFS